MRHRRPTQAVAIAASVLIAAAPAMAKGGGHEHGGGGGGGHERFEGRHDNGRHLGWDKHQRSFAPVYGYSTYRYARPWLYRPQPAYSTAWRGPRVWGGNAWPWQRTIIATGAAWGAAWGLGSYFLYQAPPIVDVPQPDELDIPPSVVSVPWMDVPTPFDDPPGYTSPAYTSPAYDPRPYDAPSYSPPFRRVSDPGPWAAPPPIFYPERSLLDAAPPPPGVAAPSLYPY